MSKFPEDYDGKLKEYDINKAEPGKVKLIPQNNLQIEDIYIEGDREGETYYSIPAINLIEDCEEYDPEFILCYLPNEKKYATWDCDHWVLYDFENTSWNNIKENPLMILNAQWHDTDVNKELFDTSNYEQIEGWPI